MEKRKERKESMKKKIVAFMMAFALAAGSAADPLGPVIVWAQERQEQVTEEGFKYEIIEDGISITGYSGDSAELVIPSEIDGKRVTSIGYEAFRWCSDLTSVTIPGSVTVIGRFAFDNCKGLTSVTISEGVTVIEDLAFNWCKGLTSVTIPGSVTSIGYEAFGYCSGLTGIDVAEGNANYASEQGVLYNKAKTELIRCPAGKQGSVTIPGSVTGIGESAFSVCSGLTGIDVAERNANYASEQGVLYNKEKTKLICCPAGKQGSVIIPGSVTSIGDGAFWACGGLTSVTIPGSVTSIGGYVFEWCGKLKDVYYAGNKAQWEKIMISGNNNEVLQSATIHYDSSGPSDGSGGNDDSGSGSVPAQKQPRPSRPLTL